jgi:hypothetical protein
MTLFFTFLVLQWNLYKHKLSITACFISDTPVLSVTVKELTHVCICKVLSNDCYSSKSRVWERDRRERLNLSFNNLSSLLPNYDPATTLSKAEILQKAANYIRELQQENHNLLHGTLDEFACKHMLS